MSITPPNDAALAPRSVRLKAALGDAFLAFLAALPGILAMLLAPVAGAWVVSLALVLLVGGFLGFAIYQMALISRDGQTLAKRWFAIRIVRKDGSPAGFGAGVFRRIVLPLFLGYLVPAFPEPVAGILGALPVPVFGSLLGDGILGLVGVLLIFTPSRRCLHDYLAGTRVVVVGAPDPVRTRQILIGALFAGVALVLWVVLTLSEIAERTSPNRFR